jgi:serine/threonine protein kinase
MESSDIPFDEPVIFDAAIEAVLVAVSSNHIEPRQALIVNEEYFFELDEELRSSIYGSVRLGRSLQLSREMANLYERTGEFVAIKASNWEDVLNRVHTEDPLKEVQAMQYLVEPGHQHVLDLITCGRDDRNLYVVTPFCDGGELFSTVKSSDGLPESEACILFHQILEGTAYLHSLNVAHRDISLENVLLHQDSCLVMDFGMAVRLPDNGVTRPLGRCGKPNYMAPEILKNRESLDARSSDVWSLGILLFILLSGIPPVEVAMASDPRFRYIAAGHLRQLVRQWRLGISPLAQDLLFVMLKADWRDRPTTEELLAHPWFLQMEEGPEEGEGEEDEEEG